MSILEFFFLNIFYVSGCVLCVHFNLSDIKWQPTSDLSSCSELSLYYKQILSCLRLQGFITDDELRVLTFPHCVYVSAACEHYKDPVSYVFVAL